MSILKSAWKSIRVFAGTVHREIKIAFTPRVEPGKWVFLTGCYNSGTTLLAEILSSHSEISALPTEGHFLTNQFVKDYEIDVPRMWAEKEELFRLTENDAGPNADRIKDEWRMRLDLSKPVFLEKSPPNTPRTRWLQKHFQPAWFIIIVRNGYAVTEGIHRKADPRNEDRTWPIDMCARQWRRSYEILVEDEPHLERVLWIKYEDLTENSADVLNRICDFLEISHFDAFDNDSRFRIHERNEPLKNMNEESICRLSAEQRKTITEIAGDYLTRFGYEIID